MSRTSLPRSGSALPRPRRGSARRGRASSDPAFSAAGRALRDERLRLMHHVLAAHEHERSVLGRELQDEISQMLLGLNIELLCLKQESVRTTNLLKDELERAQRLIFITVKTLRRENRRSRNP